MDAPKEIVMDGNLRTGKHLEERQAVRQVTENRGISPHLEGIYGSLHAGAIGIPSRR